MKALPLAIGLTDGFECQLERALHRVAMRHSADFEIKTGCKLFARGAKNRRELLNVGAKEHGLVSNADPERLAYALFHGTRLAAFGLLLDLQDLLTLVQRVRNSWTVVIQAAKELQDKQLVDTATRAGKETDTVIDWVCAHIKMAAPQALLVPSDLPSEFKASIPKKITPPLFPRLSVRRGATIGLTFVAGLLAGRILTIRR